MKILLGCLSFFFCFQALASFDIKPGLWNVKMTMTVDGKVFDPLAEVTKALESWSAVRIPESIRLSI